MLAELNTLNMLLYLESNLLFRTAPIPSISSSLDFLMLPLFFFLWAMIANL